MKNIKSKLAKFVDKYFKSAGYFWITAILMDVPLNVYGHFKGYEKSDRSVTQIQIFW